MKMFELLYVYILLLLLLILIADGGEVYDSSSNKWIKSKDSKATTTKASIDNSNENTEIFISIASYRDSRCPKTIQSIFKTAKYPNRVKVIKHYYLILLY